MILLAPLSKAQGIRRIPQGTSEPGTPQLQVRLRLWFPLAALTANVTIRSALETCLDAERALLPLIQASMGRESWTAPLVKPTVFGI